ncbi:MAG TPA: GTP-binding protein [Lachnospiraceae bacterium]|nr:GTP-binding protein [Lachnospiraceae bacterium]
MKSLLKFITCGSVDDGKSTLIGHILYDAKLLYADQEKALELDSKVGSRDGAIDYSLLLDGLMAEREQGITIDVAYRYFTTDSRSFIVADTPGHEEYTRNMAVGASFADLAIILIDAKQGVLVQTKRHARICSLMGIKHFVFAVNKMDLVGYDGERFKQIQEQINELTRENNLENVKIIPVSAVEGDNVTKKSDNMPWYEGEALLTYLENVDINSYVEEGFYMPVQRVCRPNHEFRGFQGQIEAGQIAVGDEVVTLPSNQKAIVKSIHIGDRSSEEAVKGQPVTLQFDREVDVSRGCVLIKNTVVTTNKRFFATILWMDDSKLVIGKDYLVKIGTKLIPGTVAKIEYILDINSREHRQGDTLTKNEIAYCEIVLSEKVAIDEFNKHKTLGELILIDRISNMTSACGVVEALGDGKEDLKDKAAFVHGDLVARGDIFEEFYYNLESQNVSKLQKKRKTYTIGDIIPVEGESYQYPDNFDILVLRDDVAIKIRDQKVSEIINIDAYNYNGYPIMNGRGFAIKVSSKEEFEAFTLEYTNRKDEEEADILNKWMSFDTFRKVVFHSNYWII